MTGAMTEVCKVSTAKTPRGFAIDPTGVWLLVVSEAEGTIAVYAIDARTGGLRNRQERETGGGPNWVEILPVSA